MTSVRSSQPNVCQVLISAKMYGAERGVYNLTKHLSRITEVSVAVAKPLAPYFRNIPNTKILTLPIKYSRWPGWTGDPLNLVEYLRAGIAMRTFLRIRKISVINFHMTNATLLSLFVPASLRKIISVRGTLGPGDRGLRISSLILRLTARDATLTALNASLGASLGRVWRNRKIHVIEDGIDLVQVQRLSRRQDDGFVRDAVRERERSGRRIVTFIGRLDWSKGQDKLIEAVPAVIKKLPNTRFVFVGDGPEMSSLLIKTERLGVNEHVLFVGYKENPFPYYSISDVVVTHLQPSRIVPGIGFTHLEASALQKPVITGFDPLRFEVFGNSFSYVHEGTPEELADLISSLLIDTKNAEERAQKARQVVENRYSWSATARKYWHLYEGLEPA